MHSLPAHVALRSTDDTAGPAQRRGFSLDTTTAKQAQRTSASCCCTRKATACFALASCHVASTASLTNRNAASCSSGSAATGVDASPLAAPAFATRAGRRPPGAIRPSALATEPLGGT